MLSKQTLLQAAALTSHVYNTEGAQPRNTKRIEQPGNVCMCVRKRVFAKTDKDGVDKLEQ